MAEIAVVGSVNLDISIPVAHLPAAGETVLGGDALTSGGGKGANQAVGAARLGRHVAFVGAVGDDESGERHRAALLEEGIDLSGLRTVAGAPSGLAAIAVEPGGDNLIVVSPGANARLTAADVQALPLVATANVVMVQFEVPLPTVAAAVSMATGHVVVNPAPAPDRATLGEADLVALDTIVAKAEVVVPNRGELARLLGEDTAHTTVELVDQAKRLGPSVVVTLGEAGALVVESDRVTQVPALGVDAVDATAAGDSFCAGLADGLVQGASLVEAAEWATRVAAVTVTRRGAQESLPSRIDVLAQSASGASPKP
ncbi:MAG: ribokinase [Acidimicrobiales bacterium]